MTRKKSIKIIQSRDIVMQTLFMRCKVFIFLFTINLGNPNIKTCNDKNVNERCERIISFLLQRNEELQ